VIRRIPLLAALVLSCAPLYATTYTVEPRHSEGIVRWNHLGFSYPTAQFSQVEGTVDFDQADPTRSSVAVTIKLSNLSTGVPDLDTQFQDVDFFNTARYPVATFKSTRVEKGTAPDKLRVTGDLTMRGVTRPVTLDVTINKIGINIRSNLPEIGFEATTTLKRSDFGMGLFVPQVSDEVSIHITCDAIEAKAYAKELRQEADQAAADAKSAAQQAAAAESAIQK
jgi:polyisoprenoid-binding protein YceI